MEYRGRRQDGEEIQEILADCRYPNQVPVRVDRPETFSRDLPIPTVQGAADIESVTSVYQRMRMAIEELGPTYVKLGQICPTRGDLLPQALIEELKVLQDHSAPLPFSEIRP